VVYTFTKQAVDFLFDQGCEMVLVACNTSSAEALRKIQQEYLPKKGKGKKVLGVIIPAVEEAIALTKNHRIGVLATEGTVLSNTFVRELTKHSPGVKVFQQAAPLLVPFIEAGEHTSKEAKMILKRYLKPLLSKKVDTIILGCTHYGHMEKAVKKIVGKKVQVVSEGPVVARKLKEYLVRHTEIEPKLSRHSGVAFYSTDLSDRFKKLGTFFFGKPIDPKKVELH